ncbi:MAG: ribbon-helix-helix protein, CopG family [Polyangiaceae bacterium]|nr:ribbon-helix-helix protein, CopG family [Polyangiaceae bacterium]
MGRPARAEVASMMHVGFRLTQDEVDRLDHLVAEQGHRDRSALLRAWLAEGGPTSPRTNSARTPHTSTRGARRSSAASPVEPTKDRPRHPKITVTPRVMDSSPSSGEPSQETRPKSIMRELLAELNLRRDALLIRVPEVVRALLPDASMETVHEALLTLNRNGLIELRPDAGSEFLKPEDAAICPRGPRDTVFSYARWTDTSTR